ncbi:hypothetical protein AB1N83_014177 [Pleurotus pulmonarius]
MSFASSSVSATKRPDRQAKRRKINPGEHRRRGMENREQRAWLGTENGTSRTTTRAINASAGAKRWERLRRSHAPPSCIPPCANGETDIESQGRGDEGPQTKERKNERGRRNHQTANGKRSGEGPLTPTDIHMNAMESMQQTGSPNGQTTEQSPTRMVTRTQTDETQRSGEERGTGTGNEETAKRKEKRRGITRNCG